MRLLWRSSLLQLVSVSYVQASQLVHHVALVQTRNTRVGHRFVAELGRLLPAMMPTSAGPIRSRSAHR
jgi:hypothetical protein